MTTLPHVLILHEVADYAAWKKIFDNAAGIRKAAGERIYHVLRHENAPNRVVHFSAWTSLDAARGFFESPELVEIRRQAGVKFPEFLYLESLESGTL
jgi:quinol monooxygenase YgiN